MPPITYSWSLDNNVVKSGPDSEFTLLADNAVGTYSLSCSATSSARELVSCSCTLVVEGVVPLQDKFDVYVDSSGDIPVYLNLEDLFKYYGTEPMDYTYSTRPDGGFLAYKNGSTSFLEIPARISAGPYTLRAKNNLNQVDGNSTIINIIISSSAVYADNPGAIRSNGTVAITSMFRFVDCTPSEFEVEDLPPGISRVGDNLVAGPDVMEGTFKITIVATGDTNKFQEGLYTASNYLIVTHTSTELN